MLFVKEESEDIKIEEALRVKQEDTEEQTGLTSLKKESQKCSIKEDGDQILDLKMRRIAAIYVAPQSCPYAFPPLLIPSDSTSVLSLHIVTAVLRLPGVTSIACCGGSAVFSYTI
ncbi:hypothetical protein Q8A67_012527 [Cirrhinus molitorella]|uniref:Uncharacterized protein n=1 Tax=Cirrhinus molitorella TaxID=172907 RepID=A0AA88PMH3_9TELE|nr:hypothetical protein Q8A67_012527 [Cirrhinus molitorella]